MSAELHISSLVVQVQPAVVDAVRRAIGALQGAEVHAASPFGKLVVTLETASEAGILQRITDINALEGVLTATLVFHQVESVTPTEGG
jgi:nitrate reductase NapD